MLRASSRLPTEPASEAADYTLILVGFVEELVPAPKELLEIYAEVVTVRRGDARESFDSHTFQAALRLSIRKWKPSQVTYER
jgi:hypothetical protein